MVAPKGNQYALGNKGGPPRVNFDPEVEVNALLKWALTDEALVLRMFPATRGYSHDTMTRWCQESEELCVIYNMAKELIGARRELLLITNNSATPFQRYASYYDQALHAFERKDKQFEAELKKGAQDAQQANLVDLLTAVKTGQIKQNDDQ